jgi:hypothetical protein
VLDHLGASLSNRKGKTKPGTTPSTAGTKGTSGTAVNPDGESGARPASNDAREMTPGGGMESKPPKK